MGAGLVGVAAQHAQPVELDRTGVVDEHRPPQAARVPLPVDGLGVLEQAGDVAPAARAALGVARHLDGQHVVVAEAAQRGDVEAVREEVALRVAEVGAVQPHVGLVEDAVERDPAAPARVPARRARSAGGRGSARRCWPARDGNASARARATLEPVAVVDVETDAVPAELVVGCGAPATQPDSSTAPQASRRRRRPVRWGMPTTTRSPSGSTLARGGSAMNDDIFRPGGGDSVEPRPPVESTSCRRRSTRPAPTGSPSTAPTPSPSTSVRSTGRRAAGDRARRRARPRPRPSVWPPSARRWSGCSS